jgi:hypothetical protein
MHPLAGDISVLKDNEIENKISDLTKKYFMIQNTGVKAQVAALLEDYQNEISRRRQVQLEKLMNDKKLDKLVKVN